MTKMQGDKSYVTESHRVQRRRTYPWPEDRGNVAGGLPDRASQPQKEKEELSRDTG